VAAGFVLEFGKGIDHVIILSGRKNKKNKAIPPKLPYVIFLVTPEINILNIKVVTFTKKRLFLKEDLQKTVQYLEEDKYLVLKSTIDLFFVKSILTTNKPALDTVKKEIVLNNISKVFILRLLLV
jgi:hypothetical protein